MRERKSTRACLEGKKLVYESNDSNNMDCFRGYEVIVIGCEGELQGHQSTESKQRPTKDLHLHWQLPQPFKQNTHPRTAPLCSHLRIPKFSLIKIRICYFVHKKLQRNLDSRENRGSNRDRESKEKRGFEEPPREHAENGSGNEFSCIELGPFQLRKCLGKRYVILLLLFIII